MIITVINGTAIKGVTNHMKELFLSNMGMDNEIIEFFPKDFPDFCVGCKNCFIIGEDKCPHFDKVNTIWEAMEKSDLLVFAYPVYALRVPASIKSLLDHLCVHWTVHRPEPVIFEKTAVIITNSVGASNRSAQNDVKTSLSWIGVSKIYTCGAAMMGDIFIDKMSEKSHRMLALKMKKLALRVSDIKPFKSMSIKVKLLFAFTKWQHQMVLSGEETPSLDNLHYIKHGWIKPAKK